MPRWKHVCAWPIVAVCASGCIDRARINSNCEWTRDSIFPLDLTQRADRRHLIDDAQAAEGIAVRYADTEHKRRFGYGGHGGLIEYGGVLRGCFSTLAAPIERDHRVTAAQIDGARAQRDARWDLAIALPFVAFYGACAGVLCAAIRRRFASGGTTVVAAVLAAGSAAASILGVQLGTVWTAIWECVRIGDDHFGTFRAAHPPWSQHPGALFIAGIITFWVVCLVIPRPPAVEAATATGLTVVPRL